MKQLFATSSIAIGNVVTTPVAMNDNDRFAASYIGMGVHNQRWDAALRDTRQAIDGLFDTMREQDALIQALIARGRV